MRAYSITPMCSVRSTMRQKPNWCIGIYYPGRASHCQNRRDGTPNDTPNLLRALQQRCHWRRLRHRAVTRKSRQSHARTSPKIPRRMAFLHRLCRRSIAIGSGAARMSWLYLGDLAMNGALLCGETINLRQGVELARPRDAVRIQSTNDAAFPAGSNELVLPPQPRRVINQALLTPACHLRDLRT